MQKTLLAIGILVLALLAFGSAGYALANTQTPTTFEDHHGPGMHGHTGYDGMGGYGHGMGMGYGMHLMDGSRPIHEEMHENVVNEFSQALGISPEEIVTRHEEGETLWEIAGAKGLNAEEIQDLMFSVHESAMEDVVANGWMMTDHAYSMSSHMEQMWSGEFGEEGHCGGGDFHHDDSHWKRDN